MASEKSQTARASGTLGEISLFGVPVRFHFTFLFLMAFLLAAGLGSREANMASDALFVLALFLCVLLHELGHAVTARRYGIKTIEIVMYPIGGVARLEKEAAPKAELVIAFAGPLVNIILGVAVVVGASYAGLDQKANELLTRIAAANFYLAGFNLVPAFPMDGGRILRSAIAMVKGEQVATQIASRIGRGLAVMMAIYGIIAGQIFLLLIALLVFLAATQEGAVSEGRALTAGMPVRAAMVTAFHTLPHGSTLREAAQLLIATTQQDFPVVHGDQVVGLLDRTAFVRGMAGEGPEAYVSAVMDRDYVRLDPDRDLAESLPAMAEAGPCALVMDGEHLLGLLTRENIAEFLMIRKLGLNPGASASTTATGV
ncbi:MAG: site-2 protease family protein [Bryobacterales bacterium]|nr:site-2 protease family protein [Bryobacterales bacterium]